MLSLVETTAFRLESKLPPMRALEYKMDHVTFKLPYYFSYHMKTPLNSLTRGLVFSFMLKKYQSEVFFFLKIVHFISLV